MIVLFFDPWRSVDSLGVILVAFIFSCQGVIVLPSMSWLSLCAACCPIISEGWLTADSGGEDDSQTMVSSLTPMTATWLGTLRFACLASVMTIFADTASGVITPMGLSNCFSFSVSLLIEGR